MAKEVRSPSSLTRDMPHAGRGISPGAYSSPSNSRQRADSGGHVLNHIGKSGAQPASARRESTPVQGASYRDPADPRR